MQEDLKLFLVVDVDRDIQEIIEIRFAPWEGSMLSFAVRR